MSSHLVPSPPPPDAGATLAGRPVLGELADLADVRDRTMARIIPLLLRVAHDPQLLDGLSPRLWLQQVCRMTSAEASRLLGAADVLQHLPAVAAGLADGRLSWSRTIQVTRAARQLSASRRRDLDRLVDAALDDCRDGDPDLLVDRVWQQVDRWRPSRIEQAEAAARRDRYVTMQPDLFGGGMLEGRFDTAGFATLAEAFGAPLGPPCIAAVDMDDPAAVDTALRETEDQVARLAHSHGRQLADRLVQLCERSLDGTTRTDGRPVPPRPTTHIVTTADALCDADRTPGWLLTTLTGGRMKASTTLICQLVDHRGADLGGIVLDDCGQVVGVGRRHHRPPAWLRDAIWARDLGDTAPASDTAVRRHPGQPADPGPPRPPPPDGLPHPHA